MSKEFQETVQTWREKPGFKRTVITRGNRVEGEVSTTNKIYGYVSKGTRDHMIVPRRSRALAFRSGYTAKTSPGRIPSRSGGARGGTVFSRGHRVKGIKARKFDAQIKKDTQDRFEEYMSQALENAIVEV